MKASDSDTSSSSFARSNPMQVSSIRFADAVIGNLGAPLRDHLAPEDDDDEEMISMDGAIERDDPSQKDGEICVDPSLVVKDENISISV